MADEETNKKPTVKFTLRLETPLHERLVALAKRDRRSLNEQMHWMLERQATQLEAEDTNAPQQNAG